MKHNKNPQPLLRMYLHDLRKKTNVSIHEVTNKLLLSKPYYYQIEQGKKGHRMDVVFLNDLASILKTDFKTLCDGELNYQLERRELGIRNDSRWVMHDELWDGRKD